MSQWAANFFSVTPVVGGWVRVRKRIRVRFFFNIYFIVFLNSPHRETPKNVIKQNREKIGFGFLVEFFVKTFGHDFFCKTLYNVLELPSLRNTRKRDKTKKAEEKLTSNFLGKVFDTDFLPKYFYGVFELPLPRNAQKRTKKNVKKKKCRMVGGWV